jgi:cell division protein FtsI (penicillin-binding protein 3)
MVRLSRVSVIHLMLVLFGALLIGQAARVQLMQGKSWSEKARAQQFRDRPIEAARGNIFDAAGNVLGESREMFKVSIAPSEVKNPTGLANGLRALGINRDLIKASLDKRRKWLALPGLLAASDMTALNALSGVHVESTVIREYVSAPGIRRIVGNLDPDGRPLGGIELSLDSILRGDSAMSAVARDVRGRRLDSPESWERIPRAGNNVTLTINRDLQDICERALVRAVDSLDASGGDIVVMNPNSGEVLAMASIRLGQKSLSITAVTEPFEPGSTLKPFIAAALLERNRARADEVINTHNGQLVLNGRTITDLHKAASMPLSDVLRYSSNIGMVQFGERLDPREKYETLRDLGLGVGTGVPLPGESDGVLREPKKWSNTSEASIVMGYELTVTPLQLVAAYSALANGGELLQPHVIKEIRGADGDVIYQARRRVLRRVYSEKVANQVRELLRSVVDSGTAVKADLAAFEVAGKSGTARRTVKGKGYVAGNYTASFVGVFPADNPQFVILVKLDSPKRAYYGGEVAAPVTSVVLRAALAARNAALDRTELARVERDIPLTNAVRATHSDSVKAGVEVAAADSAAPKAVELPTLEERTPEPGHSVQLPFVKRAITVDKSLRAVPDIAGLSARSAVRALHRAGFRVMLASALGSPTVPAAGTFLPAGSVVKLQHIP